MANPDSSARSTSSARACAVNAIAGRRRSPRSSARSDRIRIIVDNENADAAQVDVARRGTAGWPVLGALRRRRERDRERRAAILAFAVGSHRAAVQLDEVPDD